MNALLFTAKMALALMYLCFTLDWCGDMVIVCFIVYSCISGSDHGPIVDVFVGLMMTCMACYLTLLS